MFMGFRVWGLGFGVSVLGSRVDRVIRAAHAGSWRLVSGLAPEATITAVGHLVVQ